jgi:hypothetical protein
MTDTLPNPTESPTPRKRAFVVQVLIVLGCAVLLTGGSIFGVVATCNFNSSNGGSWPAIFLWSTFAGLAIIVLCLLFIVAWGILMIIKKVREN